MYQLHKDSPPTGNGKGFPPPTRKKSGAPTFSTSTPLSTPRGFKPAKTLKGSNNDSILAKDVPLPLLLTLDDKGIGYTYKNSEDNSTGDKENTSDSDMSDLNKIYLPMDIHSLKTFETPHVQFNTENQGYASFDNDSIIEQAAEGMTHEEREHVDKRNYTLGIGTPSEGTPTIAMGKGKGIDP
jgi:hypothetical protein